MDRIQSLKQELKVLKTLITMQLRERLDISFKGRIKKSVFKLSIYLLLFVALTAIIYLVLYLLSSLGVFGIGGYIPVSLFNVLFISLLLITTLACIDKFTNALFFSNDNQVLLTFPANEKTIFLSKVLTFLVLELIRNSFVFCRF